MLGILLWLLFAEIMIALQLRKTFAILGVGLGIYLGIDSAYRPHNAIALSPLSVVSSNQLIQRGLELYRQQEYEQSRALFEQSLARSKSKNDLRLQGLSLVYRSMVLQQLQDWSAADQSIQEAISVLQSLNAMDPRVLGLGFNTKGRLSLSMGQPEQALEEWQQAEKYYRLSSDSVGQLGALVNQSQALTLLGYHHRACKALFRAIDLDADCNVSEPQVLDQAVRAFLQQPNEQVRSLGVLTLGNLLRLAGNYRASERLLTSLKSSLPEEAEARSLFLSLGRLNRVDYDKKLSLYQKTSNVVLENEYKTLGLDSAKVSLTYFEKVVGKHRDLMAIQAQLAQWKLLNHVQTEWGPKGLATVGYSPSVVSRLKQTILDYDLRNQTPSLPVLQGQLSVAEQLLAHQPQVALSYAKTAFDGARQIQSATLQSQALGLMGRIYEHQSQWQGAKDLTARALAIASARQDPLLLSEWQWQLGRIYEQQGQGPQSLQAFQSSVENLEIVRQNLRVMQNEVEFSFRENIEPVYRQYVNLLLQDGEGQALPQSRLKQAIKIFDDFQVAELEDFLNCNLELRSKIQPDSDSAFVYPIILGDRIQVIIQPPGQQPLVQYSVNVSDVQINETLRKLRREQEQTYVSDEGLRLSQQVYDWILRPAETHLKKRQVKTLVFVLDGLLRNISIGALHDGEQYLLEKDYSIALLPGLELFTPQDTRNANLKALTFGLSQGNPPLPDVPRELATIDQFLESKQYLDQSFSSQTLSDQLLSSAFPIVHLATHGQFSSNPDDTYLLTWDKKVSGDELSQLLQNRANSPYLSPIDLLVLSACQTAKGDPRAILGLAGIAVQSGARSTLSSLWSVNDRSTAFVMSEFYRVLASSNKITKAEALRRAQLKLLNTPGYESPRFWGAYVLVGNWR